MQPGEASEGDAPHRVPLLGSRYVRLEFTADEVDNAGHVRRQSALGQNGRDGAADERITRVNVPIRVVDSACGASGWLWRTAATHVEGHGTSAPLGVSTRAYDACGDAVLTEAPAVLPATPRFAFDGSTGALGYTQADQTTRSSVRFDVWGQPLESCVGADLGSGAAPNDCDRYTARTYDGSYGAFVERESIAAAPSGPHALLVVTGQWDQGLGVLESATDPNGLISEMFYDGLGRVTGTLLPNVKGCANRRVPTQRIFYDVAPDPAARPVHRIHTIQELSCEGIEADMQRSYTYLDGLGRVRAVLAQGDARPESSEDRGRHPWVKSGVQRLNRKGKPFASYETDSFDGDPASFAAVLSPPRREPVLTYADAFGRVRWVVERDGTPTETRYHALSTEVWDTIDLGLDASAPWCFAGTYSLTETDGHGRLIHQRLHQRRAACSGAEEFHHVYNYYRADGSLTKVVRALAPSGARRPPDGTFEALTRWVERRFVYDSQGRRIASFDPNTDNPNEADEGKRSWRYLYNRVGDLAAVRDPRGCGQNFFYDRAGRLTGEQYVRCAEAQLHAEPAVDTVPAGTLGVTRLTADTSVHARFYFDEYPTHWPGMSAPLSRSVGRPTATIDRGQRSFTGYDDRGLAVYSARQMALLARPGSYVPVGSQSGPTPAFVEQASETMRPVLFDTEHTYESHASHDHAGRVLSTALPRDPAFAVGTAPRVGGELEYDRAGRVRRASVVIGGDPASRYDVVSNIRYTHDQLPAETTYGDTRDSSHPRGGRAPTVSTTLYDVRRRPSDLYTVRSPTSFAAQTLAEVSMVADQRLRWDAVSNLIEVYDERPGSEWPDGHRPQSSRIEHDALYRVEKVTYRYSDDDAQTAFDDATDWRATVERHRAADPMKSRPAAMLARPTAHRAIQLTYRHDWLANTTSFGDDARQFYERSIGTLTNGADISAGASVAALRPSALYLASDLQESSTDRGGWLELDYGAGGNVTAMTVHARCTNRGALVCMDPGGSSVENRRATLRTSCACAAEQHYSYRYDELNRLSEARRIDREAGTWTLKVRQRYRYDAANQRTIKETLDVASSDTRATLYVSAGDFERRGLRVTDAAYQTIPGETETQYLVAGARVVWQSHASPQSGLDPDHRITFAVTDILQSTSAVIDLMSGELLESTGFYPNGAREHWLDCAAANATSTPLEPLGFTGKEADEEVGLTYFGQRYLVQRLGRWSTPDPAAIHAAGGGEVLNTYHYVSGSLLQARDPLGLDDVIIAKPKATQADPDAKHSAAFARQWQAAAPDRHFVPNQRALEDTLRRATAQAGSDGRVAILDHGSTNSFEVSGSTISLPGVRAAKDEKYATQLRELANKPLEGLSDQEVMEVTEAQQTLKAAEAYKTFVAGLKDKVKEIYVAGCSAGNSRELLQEIANDTHAVVRGHAAEVGVGTPPQDSLSGLNGPDLESAPAQGDGRVKIWLGHERNADDHVIPQTTPSEQLPAWGGETRFVESASPQTSAAPSAPAPNPATPP